MANIEQRLSALGLALPPQLRRSPRTTLPFQFVRLAGGSMQDLEVRLATHEDRLPLYRMLELYQHDLSDVWDQDLDSHGEYGYALDDYWGDPACQPFVFVVAGRYAGFALVDAAVQLAGSERWIAQFFVVKKYRRQGVGRAAARAVFDRLPGRWEVGQMLRNAPAQAFWRRVIGEYTGGRFVEHTLDQAGWQGVLQCFDNTQGPAAATLW